MTATTSPEEPLKPNTRYTTQRRLGLLLFIVLVVGLGVGLAIGLSQNKQDDIGSTSLESNLRGSSQKDTQSIDNNSEADQDSNPVIDPVIQDSKIEVDSLETDSEEEEEVVKEEWVTTPSQINKNDTGNQQSSKEPIMEWPNLLNMDVDEAKKIIEADRPDLKIQIVLPGYMVTMDYVTSRVRLWIDEDNKIMRTPKVG